MLIKKTDFYRIRDLISKTYRNVVGGGDTEQEKGGRCRDGEDGCREGEGGGVESGDF